MELAVLRRRGPRLVPQLSLLHEVHQGDFLHGQVAPSHAFRRVQAPRRALSRHSGGRWSRRRAASGLGEAGERDTRLERSGRSALTRPRDVAARPGTSQPNPAVFDPSPTRTGSLNASRLDAATTIAPSHIGLGCAMWSNAHPPRNGPTARPRLPID